MQKKIFWLFSIALIFLLSACDEGTHYAPVVDMSNIEPIPKTGSHRVSHGETLYEIAWRYGLDYRYLAARNQMTSPYILHTGQIIYLHGNNIIKPNKMIATAPAITAPQFPANENFIPENNSSPWFWPARGKVMSMQNKGINILGNLGEPVLAAANGRIVYAGNGLRGYGNLIIIKHNNIYLSAYAHNQLILVSEGQVVRKGQEIAKMGNTGTDKVMLHFEIRRAGKAVNPLSFYPTIKL